MLHFLQKVKNFSLRAWMNFRTDSYFSVYYALLRIGGDVGRRLGLKKFSAAIYKKRDEWIYSYLYKNLSTVISKHQNNSDMGEKTDNSPIWVCWWMGVERASELIKRCVTSIYENAGNHPVYLITEDNYAEYLDIPAFMLDNVRARNMGLAHLADYIRVKLLATYGGLWLDATIYCTQQIPNEFFELPMYTMKGPVGPCGYISRLRWVTFCLGGWKGNIFYSFLTEALEEYWENNKFAVDYLFFDYVIEMAYSNIPAIRKLLDNVPDNNIHRDDLQAAMNAALSASEAASVIKPDTVLYKLSWREQYSEVTDHNELSIYGAFIRGTDRQ